MIPRRAIFGLRRPRSPKALTLTPARPNSPPLLRRQSPLQNLVGPAGFSSVDFRDPTKFYMYNFCSAFCF